MPRLQSISKYCVSCRSAAFASSNEYAMLTPCNGSCRTPFTMVGAGSPAASRTLGATSITWWNCERSSPLALIPFGQRIDEAADVMIGELEECRVDLHLARQHRTKPCLGLIPRGNLFRPLG